MTTVSEMGGARLRSPEEIRRNRLRRAPFLALGLAFFAAALYGGLWRLGFGLPAAAAPGEWHGPLMICGFFGSLIGLERAMALRSAAVLAAPALSCAGALALLAGAPYPFAAALFALAAATLTTASLVALRAAPRLSTGVLASGAAAWGVGSAAWWSEGAVSAAAPWWMLFLVATIVAERLDKGRARGVSGLGRAALVAAIALAAAGAALGLFSPSGPALLGAGLLGLAAWAARNDVALREMNLSPHLRFFGLSMAAGYLWLALAGLSLIAAPPSVAPYGYDLALHAVLIGFVLSMAMGHSVIVVPAITGRAAPYGPSMYVGLGLLHVSLALRAGADALVWPAGRMASGPLTILALAAFALALGREIARAKACEARGVR